MKKKLKKIENEIKQKYNEEITNFVEKCRIGENDSYICSLIHQDSAEEFISYVNRINTSLSSRMQPSIFETNLFLMQKTPTLIEYASFFGSIQIVQYLRYSNVPLTDSLWLYAIHSNNAEIIHFLEENEIKPEGKCQKTKKKQNITYEKIFEESIICHHIAIADYIRDNYLNSEQIDCFGKCIINYYYFPLDIRYIISNSRYNNGFRIFQLLFSLTQITIPYSVTSIGNNSFFFCLSLTQIIIPSSVISIGDSAFKGCSSLTQIIITSSVTSISDSTFDGCSSLTQITTPSSMTSIGNNVFKGCSLLSDKQIQSLNCNKSNINMSNNNSQIKSTWKPKSNYSKNMTSPKETMNNDISWNHNSKPHNMFNFS